MVDSMVVDPVAEPQMGETAPSPRGLEVSISFGQFENDLLSWERWSSFSQNKYLEEVEKCSTPGSVAEKKAYFESHYKKVAAKKNLVANLLIEEKPEGDGFVASNKTVTIDQCRQLESELVLGKNLYSEDTVAIEENEVTDQQNQSQAISLVAEKLSGKIPSSAIQNVKINSQPSDGQHHYAQVLEEENNLRMELPSLIINEHSKSNAAAYGGSESTTTRSVKEEPSSEADNYPEKKK